jgi:hypothetical protein
MKTIVALLLGLAVLLPVFSARADLSEGEKKNLARTLFNEGVKLQESGKPADVPAALAKFEAAQKYYAAPTIMLHLAECQALTGRLIDASESYNTLAKWKIDDKDPPLFLQAQQQGAGEAAGVKARIPTVTVTVNPAVNTLQNLQITFNDKPMPPELIGVAHQMDPGTYRVAAYANGYLLKEPSGDVVIKEKEQKTIGIVLAPVAGGAAVPPPIVPPANSTTNAATPPPATPPPYTAPPPPQDSGRSFLVGAHLALALPFGDLPNATTNNSGGGVGINDTIGTGYGIGLDAGVRLAKFVYLGLIGEYAGYGAGKVTGDSGTYPNATYNAHAFMFGGEVGLITSPDKFAFFGTVGLDYRVLKESLADSKTDLPYGGRDATFSGGEVFGKLGVAIPVSKVRIVPYGQLVLGSFSRSKDDAIGANPKPNPYADSTAHGFLGVGMTVFYMDKL